jgi:hypothetical protein
MKDIGKFLAKWFMFTVGIAIIVVTTLQVASYWHSMMTFGNSYPNVIGSICLYLSGVILIIIGLVI